MEFPEDTAEKVAAAAGAISDSREIQTMPPPAHLGRDPLASTRYFQKIDDENSGEGNRIEVCWRRLQKIRLALSNREFKAEKSFLKSIFLMPFPAAENQGAKINVYAFDHNETSLPLDEISAEFMALTSYKDEATGRNLSRAERLNLIKALTEYYDDLVIKLLVKSSEAEQGMNLEVNYLSAMEIFHRLDFELMVGDVVVKDPDQFPRFRVGRELLVITPDQVGFFKQKIIKYFLDKHRKLREEKGVTDGIQAVRSGIRTLNDELAASTKSKNGVLTDKQRKSAKVDLKIRNLQLISSDILLKISADGFVLDLLRAMVMVEELTKTEAIRVDEYIDLFELKDESEARSLATKVANARVDISKMNLPKEIISSLISEFLTKKILSVRPDVWEKMVMAEE